MKTKPQTLVWTIGLVIRAVASTIGLFILVASVYTYRGLPEMWDPATFGLLLVWIGWEGRR